MAEEDILNNIIHVHIHNTYYLAKDYCILGNFE